LSEHTKQSITNKDSISIHL